MKKFLIGFLIGLAVPIGAQELVTLTTPQTTTVTSQHVGYVAFDLDNSKVIAQVEDQTGKITAIKVYDSTTTPTGATLLHQINTGNFSINSLMKAVYNRLQTDGVIPAGIVTGTPQ